MNKIAILIFLLFSSLLEVSFAQQPAQPVTIEGYSNPSAQGPALPNQPMPPVDNAIPPPSDGSIPSQTGSNMVAPSDSTQPLAQPSAPTSVMQPVLPAVAPQPPAVPTPDHPDNLTPLVR